MTLRAENDDLITPISGEFAPYDLTQLYLDYEKNRYMYRLDPCTSEGRPLYVQVDQTEINVLWQVVARTRLMIYDVVTHWIRSMNHSITSVYIESYDPANGKFTTYVVIAEGKKTLRLESRLTDGVDLALVSGCGLFVARDAEAEHYANIPPEHPVF
jgi:bifunctional DNase/RNase